MEFAKIVLSSLLSYAALFICAKVIGRKQISQLNFLDYITGITIGSIAAELASDLENTWKPLAAMGVYALLTWLLSLIGKRAARSRKFLDGTPTIIMQNGKLYRSNMKKAKLDLSEFMVMCREQGYFNLADIHTAVFEYNGKLTILPVSKKRPVTPEDMKLSPEQETLSTEVIMDGRILEENLQRMGLNAAWLDKQLRTQGVHDAKAVFLGLYDAQNKLTLYKMDP
ncbi:MAG: DUF421 domain-containing protein [Clostridiales bacterium]|nr:DUF421 domain-containing protein [Clostridiales bacterium]